MYPSVFIGSYGCYLLAMYAASFFNPATYLGRPVTKQAEHQRNGHRASGGLRRHQFHGG